MAQTLCCVQGHTAGQYFTQLYTYLGNATDKIATLQFQQSASLDKGKPFYYRLGAIHCQISRLMSLYTLPDQLCQINRLPKLTRNVVAVYTVATLNFIAIAGL